MHLEVGEITPPAEELRLAESASPTATAANYVSRQQNFYRPQIAPSASWVFA